jgi:hypothetical protein
MATQRSIRLTANPRPPCPGQPDADPGQVRARRGLTGAVRDIDSCIDHHLDDTRRYVEAAGLSASTIQEVVGRLGLMTPCVRPIYPTDKLCGTAVTVVLQPGDNWMLRVATSSSRPRVAPSARTASPASCSPRRCAPRTESGRSSTEVTATSLHWWRGTSRSSAGRSTPTGPVKVNLGSVIVRGGRRPAACAAILPRRPADARSMREQARALRRRRARPRRLLDIPDARGRRPEVHQPMPTPTRRGEP